MKYIGQSGRSFLARYQEHFRDYKYNNGNSKYSNNLLDNIHSFGPIHEIMDVLHIMKKGKTMDTLEKFQIYLEIKIGRQINDENTVTQNTLFDILIKKTSDRGHHGTGFLVSPYL